MWQHQGLHQEWHPTPIVHCCRLLLPLQRVYRAYAARLVARLPKPSSGSLSAAAVLGASDWHVRLADEDVGVVCLIVSTAEHCQVGCWGWLPVKGVGRGAGGPWNHACKNRVTYDSPSGKQLVCCTPSPGRNRRWCGRWRGRWPPSWSRLSWQPGEAPGGGRGGIRQGSVIAQRLPRASLLQRGRLPWCSMLATIHAMLIQPTPLLMNCFNPPRVDMSEEEDEFQGVITLCLASLLLGIETRLEGALGAMARLNWAGMEMVRRLWQGGAERDLGAGSWCFIVSPERCACWRRLLSVCAARP